MGHEVTLIPGDGIGPEVMGAAVRVVEATGTEVTWDVQEVGTPAVETGRPPLPAEVLDSVIRTEVAFKGPVSTRSGKEGFPSVNVALRRELDLYAQVRPCRSRPGAPSVAGDVDLAVIRETTEDLYAGIEFPSDSAGAATVIETAASQGRGRIPPDAGISIKFTTPAAARRILEFAFRYAVGHGRSRLTVAHKATVMRCTDGLFLEIAQDVASQFPTVTFEALQIDNLCGQLVRRPADFEVLVMGIHYGDIVSDLAAGLVGGIGTVPGVNYGPKAVMFEPAHGTVPARAGKDQADPMAAILCGALMLDHLGEADAAERVQRAVDRVVARGDAVTYDLVREDREPVGTSVMTEAIIAEL